MGKKKTYAKAVMNESVARNEPVVTEWPKPPLPYSQNGLLVGTRHYGDLCAANPKKSPNIKVVCPDEDKTPVVAGVAQEAASSGCTIL